MAETFEPLVGQKVGPEESITVLKRIGRGASGSIFLGEDRARGVLVALKFLSPEYAQNPFCVKGFL
jgi:serine/threonine protein kinase